MNQWLLEEINRNPKTTLKRFNVDQYLRLIEAGILEEGTSCELLDGYIVLRNTADSADERTSIGTRHAAALNSLVRRLILHLAQSNWSVNCLSPIALNRQYAPEPDLAVIQGKNSDYLSHFPGPAVIQLIVDIADSRSLRRHDNLAEKYAQHSIPEYWIVSLPHQHLEVYDLPERELGRYARRQILKASDTVKLTIPGVPALLLSVQEILHATV